MLKLKFLAATITLFVTWTAWAESSVKAPQEHAPEQRTVPVLVQEDELPMAELPGEEQTFFVPELGLEEPFQSSLVGGCPGLVTNPMCHINAGCAAACDNLIGPCYTQACQDDLCDCKAGCVECPW